MSPAAENKGKPAAEPGVVHEAVSPVVEEPSHERAAWVEVSYLVFGQRPEVVFHALADGVSYTKGEVEAAIGAWMSLPATT